MLLGLLHLSTVDTLSLRRMKEREVGRGRDEYRWCGTMARLGHTLYVHGMCYLVLQIVNESPEMLDQKRPRVDEEDPVHHHHNQGVPVANDGSNHQQPCAR